MNECTEKSAVICVSSPRVRYPVSYHRNLGEDSQFGEGRFLNRSLLDPHMASIGKKVFGTSDAISRLISVCILRLTSLALSSKRYSLRVIKNAALQQRQLNLYLTSSSSHHTFWNQGRVPLTSGIHQSLLRGSLDVNAFADLSQG